jgi:O-acetylserine/cysteine efflux transporter
LSLPQRLAPRDLLLVLAVVTIWGFAFVTMRWALDSVPPFALAALRFLFAAVPALFFIPRPAVSWGTLVVYGFAIGVFQFGLLFLGMKLGMPAGLSSLVIQTQAFFTIGLAAWWLHDRFDRYSLIGAAIAASGIAVLAWHKFAAGATATLLGFLLVLGAALAWAVGNIVAKAAATPAPGRRLRRGRATGHQAPATEGRPVAAPPASATAGRPAAAPPHVPAAEVDKLGLVIWASLAAPLPLALASWIYEGGSAAWDAVVHMDWKTWACVLFMSYFATLFGLASWNALLHRYPTAVITPFALLIPVSGLVSGAVFLAEDLAPLQFAGVALVLVGLAWNVFGAQARSWIARAFD